MAAQEEVVAAQSAFSSTTFSAAPKAFHCLAALEFEEGKEMEKSQRLVQLREEGEKPETERHVNGRCEIPGARAAWDKERGLVTKDHVWGWGIPWASAATRGGKGPWDCASYQETRNPGFSTAPGEESRQGLSATQQLA